MFVHVHMSLGAHICLPKMSIEYCRLMLHYIFNSTYFDSVYTRKFKVKRMSPECQPLASKTLLENVSR